VGLCSREPANHGEISLAAAWTYAGKSGGMLDRCPDARYSAQSGESCPPAFYIRETYFWVALYFPVTKCPNGIQHQMPFLWGISGYMGYYPTFGTV